MFHLPTPGYMLAVDGVFACCIAAGLTAMACIRVCIDSRHCIGAVALLFFATWRRLYGLKELGRIQGVAQMLTVFASASGPLLFSYTKKLTLSYDFVFQIMGMVAFAMAVVAWFTPLPIATHKIESAI